MVPDLRKIQNLCCCSSLYGVRRQCGSHVNQMHCIQSYLSSLLIKHSKNTFCKVKEHVNISYISYSSYYRKKSKGLLFETMIFPQQQTRISTEERKPCQNLDPCIFNDKNTKYINWISISSSFFCEYKHYEIKIS
jgi:hypothetical protein